MSEAVLNEAWRRQRAGDHAGAERMYRDVLAREPQSYGALYRLGFLYGERGRFEEAERYMEQAIRLRPSAADAHFLRGSALLQLSREAEAVLCFDKAVALDPALAPAWFNRAVALLRLARYEEALASAGRALALAPKADALVTSAVALVHLDRKDEACAAYDRALALDPNSLDARINRATLHYHAKRYEAAAADCEAALGLNPDLDYMQGYLLMCRRSLCDWRNDETARQAISARVRAGQRAIQPLMHLAVSDSPAELLQAARIWAQSECRVSGPAVWRGERYRHGKIRVAYLSEDFRTHPVGQLIAGVLERHDRTKFEITGISLGPDDGSALRGRIANACRFRDAARERPEDTAAFLRDAEIDIAVDLTGFSGTARSTILPRRPAPVQASFLGYAGTMGADWIDYLIADAVALPNGTEAHYREKIVRLPGSFMPAEPFAVAQKPKRAQAGLPSEGFVFACFNNAHKIAPGMFDIWMRLLTRVEGSVLWLGRVGEAARANLSREAQARGVDPARIVFAPFVEEREAHLARLSLADLFLDTLPQNAHSVALEALGAGVPVLTVAGSTFAGRVAASLNAAMGMSALATASLADYEHLALALARDPARLSGLRAQLTANRVTHPLFDTAGYTRNLEAAFLHMHDTAQEGRPPQAFSLARP